MVVVQVADELTPNGGGVGIGTGLAFALSTNASKLKTVLDGSMLYEILLTGW